MSTLFPRNCLRFLHGWARVCAKIAGCAFAFGGSVAACGDSQGGTAKPDVNIAPIPDVTLVNHNATQSTLYVDWPASSIPFSILRDGTALLVDLGCMDLCAEQCNCSSCPVVEPKVRQLDPGDHVSFVWKPIYYEQHDHQCEASSCKCGEAWPVTAGNYDVVLAAGTAVKGGTPDPSDPKLLIGAQLDPTGQQCPAESTFALGEGTNVQSLFQCP